MEFDIEDNDGQRKLIVPENEMPWAGNPIPIVLDIEARTRTRLKNGENPIWFIRLHKHFMERNDPADKMSFAEYVSRRHPVKIEATISWTGTNMAISEAAAAEVLSQCARHCCICRRFKPLHLHVHHIRERADGGTDDLINLIAVCMTCHSDIHTQTKLTRRFTEKELILHRDAVCELVRLGRLPATEIVDGMQQAYQGAMNSTEKLSNSADLIPESIELLLSAVKAPISENGEPALIALHADTPFFIRVGREDFGVGDPRKAARYKKAFYLLIERGFFEHDGGVTYKLTDDGWLLGDELLAEGNS